MNSSTSPVAFLTTVTNFLCRWADRKIETRWIHWRYSLYCFTSWHHWPLLPYQLNRRTVSLGCWLLSEVQTRKRKRSYCTKVCCSNSQLHLQSEIYGDTL